MSGYLTKEQTNTIRGIAACMIVMAHYVQRINAMSVGINVPFIDKLGRYGVAIFFACSGYGLVETHKRDKELTGFWKKRMKTVFLPYWFIQAVSLIMLTPKDVVAGGAERLPFAVFWYKALVCACLFLFVCYFLGSLKVL